MSLDHVVTPLDVLVTPELPKPESAVVVDGDSSEKSPSALLSVNRFHSKSTSAAGDINSGSSLSLLQQDDDSRSSSYSAHSELTAVDSESPPGAASILLSSPALSEASPAVYADDDEDLVRLAHANSKSKEFREFHESKAYLEEELAVVQEYQSRLQEAARRSDLQLVKECLSAGADPNFRDKEYGWTALHHAAREKRTDIGRVLLEYGGDPNIIDSTGQTALHRAVFYNHREMIALLLTCKADPTIMDHLNQTPLSMAQERTDVSVDAAVIATLQRVAQQIYAKRTADRKREEASKKERRKSQWAIVAPPEVSASPQSSSVDKDSVAEMWQTILSNEEGSVPKSAHNTLDKHPERHHKPDKGFSFRIRKAE